jgi:hypothetical protein
LSENILFISAIYDVFKLLTREIVCKNTVILVFISRLFVGQNFLIDGDEKFVQELAIVGLNIVTAYFNRYGSRFMSWC